MVFAVPPEDPEAFTDALKTAADNREALKSMGGKRSEAGRTFFQSPGISYHAYPWRGDLPGRRKLSRRILRKLRQNADRKGERKELEKWLKKYGGPRD